MEKLQHGTPAAPEPTILHMAAHETPTEGISAGDGAASSLRLSGEEREALRLLVNERQRAKLKIKPER